MASSVLSQFNPQYLNKKSQDRRYISTISARVHAGSIKMFGVILSVNSQQFSSLIRLQFLQSQITCVDTFVTDLWFILLHLWSYFSSNIRQKNKNLSRTRMWFRSSLDNGTWKHRVETCRRLNIFRFFCPVSSVVALLCRSVHYFLSTTGENTWNIYFIYLRMQTVKFKMCRRHKGKCRREHLLLFLKS